MSERIGISIALAAIVALLLIGVLTPDYSGYAVAIACPLICLVFTRVDPVRLACAVIVMSPLAHTLKRAIYTFGDQPSAAYYAVAASPSVVALLLFLVVFRRRGTPLSWSGRFLVIFALIAAGTTMARTLGLGAAAGLFTYLAPAILYFVGFYIPEKALAPMARTAVRVGVASILYGGWQFLRGPTFIDRAWAERAANVSTQAAAVLDSIYQSSNSNNLFRPHSFDSDPFTWAVSLITMVALAGMAGLQNSNSRLFKSAIPIAIVGLPLCLFRSPLFGFVAMIAFFYAIRARRIKGPGFFIAFLAISGVLVVGLGQYLVTNFGGLDALRGGGLESRFLGVGTLEARVQAGTYLAEALDQYPIVGAGLGASASGGTRDSDTNVSEIAWSHNIVVDLVYTSGGIGALCFFVFLFRFFAEVMRMCKLRQDPAAFRVGCWAAAAVCSFFLMGFTMGAAFLDNDFFLLAGIGAGWAARRRFALRRGSPVSIPVTRVNLRKLQPVRA